MLTRNTRKRVPPNRQLWNIFPLEMWKVLNNQANDRFSRCFVLGFFLILLPSRGTAQCILRCTELGAICSFAVNEVPFIAFRTVVEQPLVVPITATMKFNIS